MKLCRGSGGEINLKSEIRRPMLTFVDHMEMETKTTTTVHNTLNVNISSEQNPKTNESGFSELNN